MKIGKVSGSVLKRSVFKQLHSKNPKILTGPSSGSDGGTVDTAPVTAVAAACVALPSADQPKRAVVSAVNSLAAMGTIPEAITATVTIPTLWNEAQLRELVRDLDLAGGQCGCAVAAGHTQVSRSVKNAVISVTAMGAAGGISSGAMTPGMDLIATKWIALDGTGLLAAEKEEELRKRFAQPFIDKARAFSNMTDIIREAAVAVKSGAAAMHDVSEGGIFGALWEMAEASGVGLDIDLRKIPIRQETVEICEFFDINPYKLLSAGCLLIAAEDGNGVVRELEKEGINAVIIGKATDSNDRVLVQEGERRFLETAQTDEIFKVFDN